MKRLFVLFIVGLLCVSSIFCADLRIINFSLIEKAASYENMITPVLNNTNMFSEYHSKDNWGFEITYEEAADTIEKLYKEVCANQEKDNAEYYLLKAIASDYLYNFDKITFEEAENNYLFLKAMKKHDYRCEWFLAKFYCNATRTKKALDLITKVVDQVSEEVIHPFVYYDYGIIATYSFMPATAVMAFEKYSKLTGFSVEDIPLYNTNKKALKDYDGSSLNINDVFNNITVGEDSYLYSRFEGCKLALRPDWEIEKGNAVDTVSYYFSLKSAFIESNGQNVSYTVIPYICASDNPEDSYAYKKIQELRTKAVLKEVKFKTKIKNLKAYEFTDKNVYTDVGGFHGMVVLFTVDYHEDADIRFDTPYEVSKSNGQPVIYYKINEDYRRYQGPVTYAIVLDSCEYIYKQSVKEFIEFLNNSQFE